MSILDNIEAIPLDVHDAIDLEGNGDLYPMRYSRGFVLVIDNTEDNEENTEAYIQALRSRIRYLFGADDMRFAVCRNVQRIKELSLIYNFNSEYGNPSLIIIQFNNPKRFHNTIRLYIKLFLCFLTDYVDTPNEYLADVISIYASEDRTIFCRDYSTRSYTPGIFWKYYYSKSYDYFRAKEHIVRCLNYKFTLGQNSGEDYYNIISIYLKKYKDELVGRTELKPSRCALLDWRK